MNLLDWFARNPIAANLLMVFIVVVGLSTLPTTTRETWPDFSLDLIQVSVVYRSAPPEAVERGILVPIEASLRGLPGVGRITSRARVGAASVFVEVNDSIDATELTSRIRARVDAIKTLPEEAERPVVERMEVITDALLFVLTGSEDLTRLKRTAARIRDRISLIPGVGNVQLLLVPDDEVSIDVSRLSLWRHGLALEDVAQAVRTTSVDVPTGQLEGFGRAATVRIDERAMRGADFEGIALLTREDGTRLDVGDVATVRDGSVAGEIRTRIDGRPGLMIQVDGEADAQLPELAARVNAAATAIRDELPPGIELHLWADRSVELEDRENLLIWNAVQGLMIVGVLLTLFLRFRPALWVALGIPIALLGAAAMMPWMDLSVNMMSLFGVIVALGLVVDDAIVVAESIDVAQEEGGDPREAAIRGVRRVAVPVFLAVVTTGIAMLPSLFLDGFMASLMRPLPLIVNACLFFSLVESLLVLPAHLAHRRRNQDLSADRFAPRRWVAAAMRSLTHRAYLPALVVALRWRYLTFAVAVVGLLLTLSLVVVGRVPSAAYPAMDGLTVAATLSIPRGASLDATDRAVQVFERSAHVLARDLESMGDGPVVEGVLTTIGAQPWKAYMDSRDPLRWGVDREPVRAEVRLRLSDPRDRSITASEIARAWRERTPAIPELETRGFLHHTAPVGTALTFELRGLSYERLRDATARLRERLAEIDGVRDIEDSQGSIRSELRVTLRSQAEALGLSPGSVAEQVRASLHGIEVQRFQRGSDEVRVVVRYPPEGRASNDDLDDLMIRTPQGALVPLSELATVNEEAAAGDIHRSERGLVATVRGEVDPARISAPRVAAYVSSELLPEIKQEFPKLRWADSGQDQEQRDMVQVMLRGTGVALFICYALVAIMLRSYLDPLLILTAVPFGFVGAIVGHLVQGLEVSNFTFVGIGALSGILLNDSLVLCHGIRQEGEAGLDLEQAIMRAAPTRLRPIVLTTLTTFFGLTPLLFERSSQAEWFKPVAASIAYGSLFSTVVVLILVPVLYLIGQDLKRLVGRMQIMRVPHD